jgi:hypothetical protein
MIRAYDDLVARASGVHPPDSRTRADPTEPAPRGGRRLDPRERFSGRGSRGPDHDEIVHADQEADARLREKLGTRGSQQND